MNKKKILTGFIIAIISISAIVIFGAINNKNSNNSYSYNSCSGLQQRELVYSLLFENTKRIEQASAVNFFFNESITEPDFRLIKITRNNQNLLDHEIMNAKTNKQLMNAVEKAFPGINYKSSIFTTQQGDKYSCSASILSNGHTYNYSYRYRIFTNGSNKQIEIYHFKNMG